MIDSLQNFIDFIGIGNFLSIILFIISTIIAFYFYFKNYYRLVYSKIRTCKACNGVVDWFRRDMEFISRVIVYNNGGKVITKNEVKKLAIITTGKIVKITILKNVNKLKTRIVSTNSTAHFEFDYINAMDYFVLEITHSGVLTVQSRISETGEMLKNETKFWYKTNLIFAGFFMTNMAYNVFTYLMPEKKEIELYMLNFVLLFLLYRVLKFIHKLFFIPDSIWHKYLAVKDKWDRDFRNKFQ